MNFSGSAGLFAAAVLVAVLSGTYVFFASGDGPLCYRVDADGYKLYSVGPNGADDGGRPWSMASAMNDEPADLFLEPLE